MENWVKEKLSKLCKTDFCDLNMKGPQQVHVYELVIASGVMTLLQEVVGSPGG